MIRLLRRMRTHWLFLLPLMSGCSEPPPPQPELPKALQEPSLVDEVAEYSSRGSSRDLVEALFADVLKSDTALRHLFNDIEAQLRNHGDSTERWVDFEQKNLAYYESAKRHAEHIADTVMRAAEFDRLRESQARYVASVLSARALDSAYMAKRSTLNDLEELVKIQRTLALMERYQKEQRPSDAVLRAELERIKALEGRLRANLKQ